MNKISSPIRQHMSRPRKIIPIAIVLMLFFVYLNQIVEFSQSSLEANERLVHPTNSQSPEVELYQPTEPVMQLDISGDNYFSCYVSSEGGLFCWGDNAASQLGDGTTTDRGVPVTPEGLQSNVSMVALGRYFGCALLDNGTVSCWGKNDYGQLGVGDLLTRTTPTQTNGFGTNKSAVSISAGDYHMCAIINDGSIQCWGQGNSGQLGRSASLGVAKTPTSTGTLGSGKTAVSISLGNTHSCAFLNDQSVKCWGNNGHGQLGIGSYTSSVHSPTTVSSFGGNRQATAISSGYQHTCAILDDGNTSCWGLNDYGQLGLNSTTSYRTPQIVDMSNLQSTFKSLSAGKMHTCGVLVSNQSACWGHNSGGNLGDGTTTIKKLPVYVENLSLGDEVVNISGGKLHTCASFKDGSLRCWGSNNEEALGLSYSSVTSSDEPSGRPIGPKSLVRATEVVENQQTNLTVRILNHAGTNLTLDHPAGLNFSNATMMLSGSPVYTLQSVWNATSTNPLESFNKTYALEVLRDTDSDGIANKYDNDDDGDSISDDSDVCPIEWGNATVDRRGCPDKDGDGVSNSGDAFPADASQIGDSDQDGYGDNTTGFRGDRCPTIYGESRRGNVFGCPDTDFDGWDNGNDSFPQQSSQWNDSDGDGYGDEFSGFQGDRCVSIAGNSTTDRFGCIDSDGDGYSDLGDAFDNNPTQWFDLDGDGYGNNQSTNATQSDAFPSDGTQWNDTDGDGHGDNKYGSQGDHFPSDPNRWQDTDEDGYANEDDAFDNDATQWNDTDGDGYGDNQNGNNADLFSNDSSEWYDSDGDGVGDNSDDFKFDGSQSVDGDNDGYGDNPNGTNGDQFTNDTLRWSDRDGDGYSDQQNDDAFINDATQWNDSDGDGFGDNANGNNPDAFANDSLEWKDTDGDGVGNNGDWAPTDGTQWADVDNDGFGDNPNGTNGDQYTNDSLRWSDTDGDGYSNQENDDAFINDATQWNDTDGDGYGDNENGTNADLFPNNSSEWYDADGDGVGDNSDEFIYDGSQSADSDGDGYGDNANGTNPDAFPNDQTEWRDGDGDGYGDNSDAFPVDATQWADTDGDGYGDNKYGSQGDHFPDDVTRWKDSDEDGVADDDDAFLNEPTQSSDRDADGYGDNASGTNPDQFPDDGGEWEDSDNDGVGDNTDAFVFDPTQSTDSDGDGYGDNLTGSNADAFPNNSLRWADTDNDGYADQDDAFPTDNTQSSDTDGDGYGDNANGTNPDAFPDDATQHADRDSDGFGDNPLGTNPDAFPSDTTQWSDQDGDGFGDNPTGQQPDQFPENPTQYIDEDGDGLGDNQAGTDADPSLNDADNDGYTDDVDILPNLASPGDLDNDGILDEEDAFPADFREYKDSDGDGEGDNADVDDDNDGWTDIDEIREGADPFSSSVQPVEGFEVIIPSTQVSLGAWDIIGIMTGVPLALWMGLGLVTRTQRGRKYEDLLSNAGSIEELNSIAAEYESSLMWKMLGPHQGLRLERMRTEIERDKFGDQMKSLPELESNIALRPTGQIEPAAEATQVTPNTVDGAPESTATAQKTDEKGYE